MYKLFFGVTALIASLATSALAQSAQPLKTCFATRTFFDGTPQRSTVVIQKEGSHLTAKVTEHDPDVRSFTRPVTVFENVTIRPNLTSTTNVDNLNQGERLVVEAMHDIDNPVPSYHIDSA